MPANIARLMPTESTAPVFEKTALNDGQTAWFEPKEFTEFQNV
jgi:hypothetical protein